MTFFSIVGRQKRTPDKKTKGGLFSRPFEIGEARSVRAIRGGGLTCRKRTDVKREGKKTTLQGSHGGDQRTQLESDTWRRALVTGTSWSSRERRDGLHQSA